MPILTLSHFPAIRAALDTELTAEVLPDDTINLPIYREAADQDVLDLDPDAETRTGTEQARVQRAAIYFCAARLAPVVSRINQMNLGNGGMSYSREVFDPDERADQLREMARKEIDAILTPDEAAPRRPIAFAKAIGRRGR